MLLKLNWLYLAKVLQSNLYTVKKGGLLDFSKTDKLTERNKENSFLDVDWIITELINYGHEKLALVAETSMSDVPNSPQRSGSSCSSHALQRSTSLKNVTKVKKKVNIYLI